MDLTLQRRRQRPARRQAVPGSAAIVPVAALLGAGTLSASLLLVLADVVSRLG